MARKMKLGFNKAKPKGSVYRYEPPYWPTAKDLPYIFEGPNIILKGHEIKVCIEETYIVKECRTCGRMGRQLCSMCIDTEDHPHWKNEELEEPRNIVLRWMRYKGRLFTYAFVHPSLLGRPSVFMANKALDMSWQRSIMFNDIINEHGWKHIHG